MKNNREIHMTDRTNTKAKENAMSDEMDEYEAAELIGDHEAEVTAEFRRTVQTARGQELLNEYHALKVKLDTYKLDDWAIEAIRQRRHEIQKELPWDDWGEKLIRARAEDMVEYAIRTGYLVKLDNGRVALLEDWDPKGKLQ